MSPLPRHRSLAAFAAVAALAATAAPASAATADVTVAPGGAEQFNPNAVSIVQGDTVNFHWAAGTHNVHITTAAEAWDSGFHGTGYNASHTFTHAGTFSFQCDAHSGMKGTVTVAAAPAPAPTPAPTPAPGTGSGTVLPGGTLTTPTANADGTPAATGTTGAGTTTADSAPGTTNATATAAITKARVLGRTLRFTAAHDGKVKVAIFRIRGKSRKAVKRITVSAHAGANTVRLGHLKAGRYRITVSAADGSPVAVATKV